MALFSPALIDQVINTVHRQQQALGAALGIAPGEAPAADSPLRAQLALLLQVANGELARSRVSGAEERAVEQALSELLAALCANPLGLHVPLSDEFWRTEVGALALRARWWLSADELITISNAAALAFGENTQATRMRVARAIESGALDWFPDPSVANPQHSRRVLRAQVERLRDLRQLPG